jgi:hypothetical protein
MKTEVKQMLGYRIAEGLSQYKEYATGSATKVSRFDCRQMQEISVSSAASRSASQSRYRGRGGGVPGVICKITACGLVCRGSYLNRGNTATS